MDIYKCEPKLDFNDVLILPKSSSLTSRSEVNLISSIVSSRIGHETIPIIAANMDGVGTIECAKVLYRNRCMTALTKHYDVETLLDFFNYDDESQLSFISIGITDKDFEKFKKFAKSYNKKTTLKVCIDVANGYMTKFAEACEEAKRIINDNGVNDYFIIAGNVVDINGIIPLNVDAVKVGIGSGSNCLTRTQTGIGYPQFSAIYDIFNSENESKLGNKLICSDGGHVYPGDIAKSLAAGAHFVMLGGMLAGTDEGGGDIIYTENGKFVEFYGMSSKTAQKKHYGEVKDYRSSEGRTTLIPYKGNMQDVITNILGGIRSTCTYVGCKNIDELHVNAKFIRTNRILNTSMEKFTIGI